MSKTYAVPTPGAMPGLWVLNAPCRDDPDLFFSGHPGTPNSVTSAKRQCAQCPFEGGACQSYVDELERGVPSSMCFGIWNGETVSERFARRRVRTRRSA